MGEQAHTTDPQTLASSTPLLVQQRDAHPVRNGALGGLCAGIVAGALGGGVASVMADLGLPQVDHILAGAGVGALALGAAAAVAGALIGVLTAQRGPRAPFLWSFGILSWSGFVATVEAAQGDWLSAARTFFVGTTLLAGLVMLALRLRPVLWKLRWLLLGWLVLCLVGEAWSRLHPRSIAPLSVPPDEPVVQLHSAPLQGVLGAIARHNFFLSFDPQEGCWHRWDLWQLADAGGLGCTSWGHVHRDLLWPESGVGGNPPRAEREWRGADARAIMAALAQSREYPYRGRYVALPGPNCNTYIAWVLRESGVSADLDPRAVGKDYVGPAGVAFTTTGTGVQAESSLLGAKVGLKEGVELHFLTFTFGIGTWPPAIKTPLGRIGFSE